MSLEVPVGQATAEQIFQGIQAQGGGSTLPSGGGGGVDIGSTLQALTQGVPQVTNADVQKALSPVAQNAPMSMPGYFTNPRSQVLPPAQMDRSEVVGRGHARAQGIGN